MTSDSDLVKSKGRNESENKIVVKQNTYLVCCCDCDI